MTGFDIYLFTRLDGIYNMCHALTFFLGICGGIPTVILLVGAHIEHNEDFKKIGVKLIKYVLPAWIFFVMCVLFIPTTKEYAAIYMIPKIANNEHVQNIPDKAANVLELKLQEWIKDMTEEKKK